MMNTETAEEMAKFYEPASGTVFHIDAHKRVTAKMIASRYDSQRGFEATSWSRDQVAVLASTQDAAEKVRDEIPDADIVAYVRAGSGGESGE